MIRRGVNPVARLLHPSLRAFSTSRLLFGQDAGVMSDFGALQKENEPLFVQYMKKRGHVKWTKARFKANFGNSWALQSIAVFILLVFGISISMGRYIVSELQEWTGSSRLEKHLKSSSLMPNASREWWENEWFAGRTPWKHVKTFVPSSEPFGWIRDSTGKDPEKISTFANSQPRGKSSSSSSKTKPVAAEPPRALVPMSGDDSHVRALVNAGWNVIAIDGASSAIRSLAEKLDVNLTEEAQRRTKLLYQDIFAPDFWNTHVKAFDLIFDRQGVTSLPLEKREDYVFLLKRALKDDGVLFVEGVYRTGRVPGNKTKGPPFALLEPELHELFPADDGYVVKCLNKRDAAIEHVTREAKVLGYVPAELHYTEFPCTVTRKIPDNLRK